MNSIAGVCDEIENHITRSSDYLNSGHVRNAVAVLESITPAVAEWAADNGPTDEMEEEDKGVVEGFFALLVKNNNNKRTWKARRECTSPNTPFCHLCVRSFSLHVGVCSGECLAGCD